MIRPFRTTRLLAGAAVTLGAVFGAAGAALAAPLPSGTVLGEGAPGAVRDSWIVVLRGADEAGVAPAATALSRRYGGAVRQSYRSAVRGFTISTSVVAARRLAADPAVAYVEQDRLVRVTGTQTDPPWGLDRIDQRSLPLSRTYTSGSAAAVTAYVLDTGIRTSHADFGGRARDGWDFIDNDAVANDCNGHGTHVAGTVGGTTHGVAKDVRLVGVRVLNCEGTGSYSQIIAGVDWVTRNAAKPAVANMSLGGSTSTALDDAVNRSIGAGVSYVLAAGNDAKDACQQSPARTPAGITVGATDSADARASFSNYGSCLDVFAPGARITSAGKATDTSTVIMSGTSMAAPHVAGAAALVLAQNPAATPDQVRDALVTGATAGPVTGAGTGSPNRLLHTVTLTAPAPAPVGAPAPSQPAPVPTCGPFTSTADVSIPDQSTLTRSLTVSGCTGNASATSTVNVQIKHSARGNLVLTLIGPGGVSHPLKAASFGDLTDNVSTTYTVNASGSVRNGTWKLQIRDAYFGNTGYLDAWTLRL